MTFLNPFLLFGLLAAAIPLIIHLLNLRKLKTIEFSTLRFLKELQRTKMRRVKITQWILLALRTLMIIALVFAFSRPALRGSFAGDLGGRAKTSMVLLLDDSPSMTTRNAGGMLFDQTKRMALDVLSLLKEGDEAFVVKLSDVERQANAVRSAQEAGTALEEMKPAEMHVSYRDAFGIAARILDEAKNLNKETYLFTDGQASHFAFQGEHRDSTDLFADNVRVFVAGLDPGARNNAANTELTVQSRIILENKPVVFTTTTRSFGTAPLANSLMGVYVEGTRVAQHLLNMSAGSSAVSSFSISPKHRGVITGYTQLDDDFEPDNRRYFTFTVPERVDVLLAGSNEDTRFMSLVLRAGLDSSRQGLINVTSVPEQQFAAMDLSKFDVVVCCAIRDFSSGESERLARFVRAGGGLIIFPGGEVLVENYNTGPLKGLGIPRMDKPTTSGQQEQGFVSFDRIDFAHPVFAGLFEETREKTKRQPTVESPRVFSSLKTTPGVNGNEIIRLSDGSGFLTEYPADSGNVFLFSIDAGLGWSDFPTKGIFAPLLYRSVLYLATMENSNPSFLVGNEITARVRLRQNDEQGNFVLRSPSGIEERILPQRTGGGTATFIIPRAMESGPYEIRQSGSTNRSGPLYAAAVNVDPRESDLRQASDDDMKKFFDDIGLTPAQVTNLRSGQTINAAILESRFGVELWKYFLVLALVCALAEMMISRARTSDGPESNHANV